VSSDASQDHAMNDDEKSLQFFGIGGKVLLQPDDPNRALLEALIISRHRRRRRGASIRKWRREKFAFAHVLMARFPDASDATIARIWWEEELRAHVGSVHTVRNWLSWIRRGGVGYGRRRR
jgi:hypothetical protein